MSYGTQSCCLGASILAAAALVGCGSGSDPGDDAATVEVTMDGAPAAGIDVVFHAPDGTPLSHVVTDANGEASYAVEAGSQITIVRTLSGGRHELVTLRSVGPGDVVRRSLEHSPLGDPGQTIGTVDVQSPSAYPGEDYQVLSTGCEATGSANPVVTFTLHPECVDQQTQTFPLYAYAQGPTTLAWTLDPAVPVSATTATLPAWNTTWDTLTFGAGTLPPDVGGGTYGVFEVGSIGMTASIADAAGNVKFPQDPAVTSWGAYTSIGYLSGTASVSSQYAVRSSTFPFTFTDDLAADLLPLTISNGQFDPTTGRPSVTWDGTSEAADEVAVSIGWFAGATEYRWSIIDDADTAASLQVPLLPPELSITMPTNTTEYDHVLLDFDDAAWADTYTDLELTGDDTLNSDDFRWRSTALWVYDASA